MHLMSDGFETSASFQLTGPAAIVAFVGVLAFVVVIIAARWKVYTKAGKPGWHSLVPILKSLTLLRIAGKPGWWFFMFLIPFVNFVFLIRTYAALARVFGRGTGFAVGLVLLSPVFLPILAFGSSRYQGTGTAGELSPQQYASAV